MTRLLRTGLLLLVLLGLIIPPVVSADATAIVGGPVSVTTVTSGVTTNTTSAIASVQNGRKSIFGEVVCSSGACVQTQAVYGTFYPTAVNGILLCTLTLSGTTRAQDACPVATFAFPYVYVITTATSGTAATGAVYVGY